MRAPLSAPTLRPLTPPHLQPSRRPPASRWRTCRASAPPSWSLMPSSAACWRTTASGAAPGGLRGSQGHFAASYAPGWEQQALMWPVHVGIWNMQLAGWLVGRPQRGPYPTLPWLPSPTSHSLPWGPPVMGAGTTPPSARSGAPSTRPPGPPTPAPACGPTPLTAASPRWVARGALSHTGFSHVAGRSLSRLRWVVTPPADC